MESVEPIFFPLVPPWAEAFPRLSEIYTISNRISPGNWFQQSNIWRDLLDNSTGLQPLEENLQVLDSASWAVFRVKGCTARSRNGQVGLLPRAFRLLQRD